MPPFIMEKTFIRKLQKLGAYSYAIVVPKQLIDHFGWRERQKLSIIIDGRKQALRIRDWVPPKKRKK